MHRDEKSSVQTNTFLYGIKCAKESAGKRMKEKGRKRNKVRQRATEISIAMNYEKREAKKKKNSGIDDRQHKIGENKVWRIVVKSHYSLL